MSEPVPVLLLAGFAGSGRTTLLSHWLDDAEFAQCAIVANEPGTIPIDEPLLGRRATVRSLCGTCACCDPRALGDALAALLEARESGDGPRFNRIVIEASGLADPVPILRALDADEALRGRCRLEGVVTTVDAVEGEHSLDTVREAMAQAMAADALVITKTDMAASLDRLEARLAKLNPFAPVTRSGDGGAHPQLVLAGVHAASGAGERRARAASLPTRPLEGAGEGGPFAPRHGGLRAITLPAVHAMDAEALRSRVEAFLERHGPAVMRLKALVPIEGRPGMAVVQAVAGTLYPVRLLARAPEGARGSITVLSRSLGEADVASLLGS